MDFSYGPRGEDLQQQLWRFMDNYIVPKPGVWRAPTPARDYFTIMLTGLMTNLHDLEAFFD